MCLIYNYNYTPGHKVANPTDLLLRALRQLEDSTQLAYHTQRYIIPHRRTSEWYSEVKGAGLSPEQGQQLQTRVQDHFQEWLETTGHGREIRELEIPKTTTSTTARTKRPTSH